MTAFINDLNTRIIVRGNGLGGYKTNDLVGYRRADKAFKGLPVLFPYSGIKRLDFDPGVE